MRQGDHGKPGTRFSQAIGSLVGYLDHHTAFVHTALDWFGSRSIYPGKVTAYYPKTGKHTISYDDGDEETKALRSLEIEWLFSPRAAPPAARASSSGKARDSGGSIHPMRRPNGVNRIKEHDDRLRRQPSRQPAGEASTRGAATAATTSAAAAAGGGRLQRRPLASRVPETKAPSAEVRRAAPCPPASSKAPATVQQLLHRDSSVHGTGEQQKQGPEVLNLGQIEQQPVTQPQASVAPPELDAAALAGTPCRFELLPLTGAESWI